MKLGKYYILGLNAPKLLALVNHHYEVLQRADKLRVLNFSELHFISAVELYRMNEINLHELRESAVAYLTGVNFGLKYESCNKTK